MNDKVNHPNHYISKKGLETIDVIEAFTEDLCGIEAVCTANILKYICRWKHKNGSEDLKKARWYLNRLLEHVDDLEQKELGDLQNLKEELTTPFADIWLNNDEINKLSYSRYDYNEKSKDHWATMIFRNLEIANNFYNDLINILKEYDCITISDIYDLVKTCPPCGVSEKYISHYGWSELDKIKISRDGLGYYTITFPEPYDVVKYLSI